MEFRLENSLKRPELNLRRERLWRRLAFCWTGIAGAELVLILTRATTGWSSPALWWLVLLAGLAAAWAMWKREQRQPKNYPAVVEAITRANPEVRHLLAAATEQRPDAASGEFGYLQQRVIDEALRHPQTVLWARQIARRNAKARNRQWLALMAMALVLALGNRPAVSRWRVEVPSLIAKEIVVTPGNTELERGSGLVISARFGGQPPAEASLVLVWASGKTQRLPLARTLADPIFGASLMEVSEDALYHVEYSGRKTEDYKIHVFEYPALTRADATLAYPAYTGLTNQTIRDTLRVSAVEGTRLDYALLLNKPVARARLAGKEASVPLKLQTNALALLEGLALTNSAHYALELVDAEGRTNKAPAEFTFLALPNRAPQIKIIFPHGDQRVSKLEEVQLCGEARDDFGLLKYGLGYGIAGANPKYVELGQGAGANEKRQFTNEVALEKLGVAVDELVSYFAWADDYGPDGKARRTFSDIFFAEVRPFETVYRADQSGEGGGGGGGQGGNGDRQPRLAELEKQIVIATWKLQKPETGLPKESEP